MKILIATLGALLAAGCQDSDESRARLVNLESKLQAMESRIATTETRLSKVEAASNNSGNWVLWRRVQYTCATCLYTPARAISAYPTHGQCVIAATRLIPPAGGQLISEDPPEVKYADRILAFHCLPPGVDGGK